MDFVHKSVLLNETIGFLNIRPDGVYVDGTLGGGGHAEAILSHLSEAGRLIGIDQDEEALRAATRRLQKDSERICLIHGNFRNTGEYLKELCVSGVDGIILDLGVSSYQLDNEERGFSYMNDAPLDMRMDQSGGSTAADVVNRYPKADLVRIFREYGEERFADRIAERIVKSRAERPVATTGELVRLITEAVPAKYQKTGGHPAKRVFQAVRIEVNDELNVLRDSLDEMIKLLNPGGRICVITFHSLEDRIVKECFKRNEHPCICPPEFPVCVCGRKPTGRAVTRHPVLPGEQEINENSRAKSAKLRVFERVTETE